LIPLALHMLSFGLRVKDQIEIYLRKFLFGNSAIFSKNKY